MAFVPDVTIDNPAPADTILPVTVNSGKPDMSIMPVPSLWVDPGPTTVVTNPVMTIDPVTPVTSGNGMSQPIIVNPVVASNSSPLGWGAALLIAAHFL